VVGESVVKQVNANFGDLGASLSGENIVVSNPMK
jgi:hypothetical protein